MHLFANSICQRFFGAVLFGYPFLNELFSQHQFEFIVKLKSYDGFLPGL